MMRSMFSAVSGLKAHQTKMDVIGNNIANVNTVAFKSQSVTLVMYTIRQHRPQQDQIPKQEQAVRTQCRLVQVLQ